MALVVDLNRRPIYQDVIRCGTTSRLSVGFTTSFELLSNCV